MFILLIFYTYFIFLFKNKIWKNLLMDSQENQDEIQANWYFRSDDKPMENNEIN